METKRKGGKIALVCILAAALAVAVFCVVKLVPFGAYDLLPGGGITLTDGIFDYDLPLDNTSPWPKFRANTMQTGRTPVEPAADESVEPWEYRTAKGIFSSPVVDKDGIAYIGSADRYFYAIQPDGTVKWSVETGEIIDSSALLDDNGRVYFGSGDAHTYCVDRETGEVIWKKRAASVEEMLEKYSVKTFNVDWFEGNMGMMPDGTILAPNDNYLLYRLDRGTGAVKQEYLVNEMIWSLPSINVKTGKIFFGTIYKIGNNIKSLDPETGKQLWSVGGIGATAASTLLTSYKENGGVIVGGYDGTLRCLAQGSGKTIWKRALRDHIYASPAQLSDGTIVQPGADGTVYALDPSNGDIKWVFDTLEPLRSSPAVDARDQIYFGSGEGKLFCLNKDGSLRWSYQCILEERNDLNSSPALGLSGVYIAGESGEIFFLPYDFPLRPENEDNPRCKTGETAQPLPGTGGHLIYTTPLGGLRQTLPEDKIEANHALTFTLVVREDARTITGQIDPKDIDVKIPGNDGKFIKQISADKRYMILIPQEYWTPDAEGNIVVEINGSYKTNQRRFGLLFFWGKKGGGLKENFTFAVNQRERSQNPFVFPQDGNELSSVLDLRRQAAPNPSMLPSLAQIGFDSLHYLAGAVSELDGKTLMWVIGGKQLEDGSVVPDPDLNVRLPLLLEYKNGLTTLTNYDGFSTNFVASWDVPITSFRIGAAFDPETRLFAPNPTYSVTADCDKIQFYGPGMKLMGVSELWGGNMYASGSLELVEKEPAAPPENAGDAEIKFDGNKLVANLSGGALKENEHVYSLLVVSADGEAAVSLPYAYNTSVKADGGVVTSVSLDFAKKLEKGKSYTAYLMVDTYPVAIQALTY